MQPQTINVVVAVHPGLHAHSQIESRLKDETGCKLIKLIHPIKEISKVGHSLRRIVIVHDSDNWQIELNYKLDTEPVIRDIPRTTIEMKYWYNTEDNLAALVRVVRNPICHES
jgi:hypothetical protein